MIVKLSLSLEELEELGITLLDRKEHIYFFKGPNVDVKINSNYTSDILKALYEHGLAQGVAIGRRQHALDVINLLNEAQPL